MSGFLHCIPRSLYKGYAVAIAALLLLSLVFPFSHSLYAADSPSPMIREITFEGIRTADPRTLKQTITSREGTLYRKDAIAEDIRRLFKLGLFQDIRVEKVALPQGLKLIYHLQERPTIAHAIFKGNKKIKVDKLEEVSKVKLYSLFNKDQIVQTVDAIRDLYNEKGYYLAEIRHELVPYDTEHNQWDVVFTIDENKEVKIKRIAFVGNQAFSDSELKKVLKTKEKGPLSFVSSSGKYAKDNLDQDVMALTAHYLTEGYLKAKASPPKVFLSRDKEELYVTFSISEGAQYRISSVDVAGTILTTRDELLDNVTLKKGDIANRRIIEEDIRRLTILYGDRGYAFANIYPNIVPDDATKSASVTYQIDKGDLITIERIIVKGNLVTRDKVIRRELRVAENALFNQSDLELSRRKIEQLGFFEEVNISTPRGSRDDTVNIVIDVKEKETGTFSIGGGFSTAEKFIVNASVQKQNFLGYGINGSLGLELSSKRQQISLSYSHPYFLDTKWILNVDAFRRLYEFEDFQRSSFGGGLSFGHPFFNFWTFFLGYRIEDVELLDVSNNVPALFNDTLSGLTSSSFAQVTRDTRNNRLTPSKGMYLSTSIEYAGSGMGGDNDFYKEEANARFYYPVVWKTVLRANAAFGYVNSLNDRPVPLFERYYLGGVNSLRGYDIRSVGPEVRSTSNVTGGDSDFVYGGNKFLLFNLEYEAPIYDPAGLRAVVFVDAGDAYAEDENLNLTGLRSNYGAGIRWISPFGPMRFEWGFPINRKEGEDPWVFNFTIGSFF